MGNVHNWQEYRLKSMASDFSLYMYLMCHLLLFISIVYQ